MAYSSIMSLGTPTSASTLSSTHFRRRVAIPSSTLSVISTTLPSHNLTKCCGLRCHGTALFSAIRGGGAVPQDAGTTGLVLADAYGFVSTCNNVTPRKIKEKGIHLSRTRIIVAEAVSGSAPSTENETSKMDEKSETYSQDMTAAMGAVLTYRHELGMNYNFILPDLIVGSCLQTPEDVDKLRSIGVKTIFCLQQDSDLEYFGVDIATIREYANKCGDIQHLRAEIRDFDAFDLRVRLPAVVSKLHKAISQNGGVTYIHCTAGLGRAPATALAYMFWVQGYNLGEAHKLLVSKRPCFPKLDAIKGATADILAGMKKKPVIFTWYGDDCSTVELSGLDIGWGQRIPLTYDEEHGLWNLHRELPEGRYEYKYIVDGEWMCNDCELVTSPNNDGHVNNYVEVLDDNPNNVTAAIRNRLSSDDPNLSTNERLIIKQFLEACPDED